MVGLIFGVAIGKNRGFVGCDYVSWIDGMSWDITRIDESEFLRPWYLMMTTMNPLSTYHST